MPETLERIKHAIGGRYEIERQVGSGGMAEIFLAEDVKHGRKVAVKVLRPDLSFTLGAERFLREIKIAANLTHPHILPLHDSGMADGLLYYVMPYFDGEALRARMNRESALPLDDALQITWEVAAALDYAHRRDIVHRDIKPGNILLADGHAVVADFGIARALSAAGGNSLTQAGFPIGTPNYWSPEQANGEYVIDGRSDIHSLGRVLYQMVVGHLPVRSTDRRMVKRGQFSELPHEHQARLDRVPPRVVQAMIKALAENPADRFETARQFADSLVPRRVSAQVVAGAAAAGGRPAATLAMAASVLGSLVVAFLLVQAGASPVVAVAAGLVLLMLAVAVTVRSFRPAISGATQTVLRAISKTVSGAHRVRAGDELESVRSIAVLPFADMSPEGDQEYFSDGIAEELLNALAKIEGLRVAARTSSFHFKGKNLDVRRIGKELGVETILEGSVRKSDSRVRITAQLVNSKDGFHLWSDTYDRGLADVFAVQQEIALKIVAALRLQLTVGTSDGPATVRMPDPEAHILYLHGRHAWNERTKAGLERAVMLFKQTIERDPNYALAHAGLADAYLLLGSYGHMPQIEALRLTKESVEKAISLDDTLPEAHATRGQVLRYELDWAGEEREYRRAIQLNPNYPTAHQWYATQLMALGRREDSIREIRRAEELDPLSGAIGVTAGILLGLAGDVDGAIEKLEKARDMAPDFFASYAWLSIFHLQEGRRDEALRTARKVAELNRLPGVVNLAYVHAVRGEREEAQTYLKEIQGAGGQLVSVGMVLAALGDVDVAFEYLHRAFEEEGWSFFTLHRSFLLYIRVGPWFDPLRSDPRFGALLERMKFPI